MMSLERGLDRGEGIDVHLSLWEDKLRSDGGRDAV